MFFFLFFFVELLGLERVCSSDHMHTQREAKEYLRTAVEGGVCVVDTASGEDEQSELEDDSAVVYLSAVWEHFRFNVSVSTHKKRGE